jgi:hypothetical protein
MKAACLYLQNLTQINFVFARTIYAWWREGFAGEIRSGRIDVRR